MKIFWHQGGIHIEPETDNEMDALITISASIEMEEPLLTKCFASSGSGESGSDFLKTIGCHDIGKSPTMRHFNDKNSVVAVGVGLQIVTKLGSGPGRAKNPLRT